MRSKKKHYLIEEMLFLYSCQMNDYVSNLLMIYPPPPANISLKNERQYGKIGKMRNNLKINMHYLL